MGGVGTFGVVACVQEVAVTPGVKLMRISPLRAERAKLKSQRNDTAANLGTFIWPSRPPGNLGSVVCAKEIFARNAGLSADGSQGRTFEVRMVGQGKGSARAVGVLAEHRDVLALVHFLKAKFLQRPNDPPFGRVNRKFRHGLRL